MGPVGQWAQIEAAPAAPSAVASAPDPAGGDGDAARPARLKRDERLVLGSIDAGAHVFQRNAREAVVGTAVFLVPAMVVNVVLSTVLFDRFDSLGDTAPSVPELVGGADAATGADTVLAYVGIVTTAVAVALAGGYLAMLFSDATFGRGVSMGRALRATARRLPALLGAWVIGHVWFLLGALVVVRARGAALAGWLVFLVPAGVFLAAVVVLASPVIAVERLGPWRGLRRAVRLAGYRFGGAVGFVIGAGTVGLALRFGMTLLPRLVEATGLVRLGSWGGLIEGVAGQVAQLLAIPVIGLATAAFYVQLRVHAEGLDLVLAADRALPAPPAPEPPS